jgi:hypothetical protein
LPGGLEDARFGAFGKNDPLGVPLQLFDQTADKTHRNPLSIWGA